MGKLKGWVRRSWQTLVVLVIPTFVVVASVPFWVIPTWQTISDKDQVPPHVEFVKTLAQIALGLGVFWTLCVAWRRATAAERTIEVAQESQITERFTRAIDQLGNQDSMAVRLGGIYALERIAKDSSKDHWQVMEVLTAYVRENSQWEMHPKGKQPYKRVLTDIQAILTVLGRRNTKYEGAEQRLDLTRTDIQGVDLSGTNLRNTLLEYSILRRANVRCGNLQGANLSSANLEEAKLSNARLQGADLSSANLEESDLICANLQEANLVGGKLKWAVLKDANLRNARLTGAELHHTDFNGANLERAALTSSNIQETYFTNANLRNADLRNVDLREARNLTEEQIDSAVTDASTILPTTLKGGHSL